MNEQTAYQELVELTQNGDFGTKIDVYILHMLANVADQVVDMDTQAVPMLVRVEGDRDLSEHATVLGSIDNIISIVATPRQIVNLLHLPYVAKLEASISMEVVD